MKRIKRIAAGRGSFKKAIVLAVVVIAATLSASGQEPGLPCDGTDIDLECPVDGGVVTLLAAGAFFGYKKLAAKKAKP